MRHILALLAAALVAAVSTDASAAADWPHPRGPALDGRSEASATALETAAGGDVGLALAWRVPLGSGYSGVAAAGQHVVTMFSHGDDDWVASFDATTGTEQWRRSLGPRYHGHDGSSDGPLSSPVLGAGTVFAIGPRGTLLALRLATGEVLWTKSLANDLEAPEPDFGYTTTPVLVGEAVVVLTGTPGGRAVTALRARDGEVLWRRGEGTVDYQSPIVMPLAGREQIVTTTSEGIVGLDPATGAVLWRRPFAQGEGAGSTLPTPLPGDRFLLSINGDAAVFHVAAREDGGYEVAERFRSSELGRTYSPPVYHEGRLFGFRGQILAAVDAETGERLWRSRPPGGDGLILVDGRLVIFATKGHVVLAVPSAEGYEERARIQALEGSSLTWPSYADGRVFVRNLDTLAAVTVTRGARAATGDGDATAPTAPDFSAWVARIETAQNKTAAVDAFLEAHPTWPLVEGDLVTFLYRGDADDVALAGSMLEARPEPMQRVAGTDLFHRTLALEPGVRWEYRFQVDFDAWEHDPYNPRTVPRTGGDAPMSELRVSGAPATHLAEPAGSRGTLDRFSLPSAPLDLEKEITVWLPPGYEAHDDRRYPLLVVTDGDSWLERGLLANTLDNLTTAAAIAPPVVVFVPAQDAWWVEAGGARTDDFVAMLATELVPRLRDRYRLRDQPATILGQRYFGLTAAYAALRHPEIFGAVALQSVDTGGGVGPQVSALVETRESRDLRWYLDWNRYDERNVDRGMDFAASSRELARRLRDRGFEVAGGEIADSWGWGGWRDRSDRFLRHFFPPSG